MIPVTKPYFTADEENEVKKVLDSGWIVHGPKVKEFEEKITRFINVKYAVATNSCTSALHLSLLALGIGKGDEVIVPSFTFIATPNSVLYTGALPVFADIDTKTYNIDPKDIERKITKRTKAIMPVHQAGLAASMEEIIKIAKKYKLFVVEDAACALGTMIGKKSVGSFGDAGCFSFHPRKSITTAEGGMVVTNNKKVAEKVRIMRSHGASISDRARHESKKFIDEQYKILGFNYRMSDIHAAIGLAQFDKILKILKKRKMLAERYNKFLSKNPYIITPFTPNGYIHTYQAYIIRLEDNSPVERNELINRLLQKGISTRIGVKASHLEPLYRKTIGKMRLKNTEKIAKKIITLPLYASMTLHEQNVVIDILQELLKE